MSVGLDYPESMISKNKHFNSRINKSLHTLNNVSERKGLLLSSYIKREPVIWLPKRQQSTEKEISIQIILIKSSTKI